MDDPKRYNHMENVLQYINTKWVSLDQATVKKNNRIMQEVIKLCNDIITRIKNTNVMFKTMYTTMYFGGSFYDGLKIGAPEEYDCDLLFKIPVLAKAQVTLSDEQPGFVQVRLTNMEKWRVRPEFKENFSNIEKCLLDDDKYMRVDKIKQWFEKILHQVLNEYPKEEGLNAFVVDGVKYYFFFRKAGPAFTVCVTESAVTKKSFLDVDLVPCLQFGGADWPSHENFRRNTSKKDSYFVVPKKPTQQGPNMDKYWRLSFQEQESQLMEQRQSLKPALKLMKLFRDKYSHKSMSSYFLKTVFLWEVDKGNDAFWKLNLSNVFMKMLERYHEALKTRCIPYFWDKRFNLIGKVKDVTIDNIANQVGKMLKDIEQNIIDPFIVATYLVPEDRLKELRDNVVLGKKHEKRSLDCVDAPLNRLQPSLSVVSETNSVASTSSLDIGNIQNSLKELDEKIETMLHEQREIRSILYQILLDQGNFVRCNVNGLQQ